MAVETLYANGTILSTGWTNPANAHGAPDAVNATSSTVGNPLNLTLADLSGSGGITATSITYGVRSMATNAGGRTQTQLVQLLDGADNVLDSFTTPTLSTTTLQDHTGTLGALSYTRAQVDALRVRITPQESGGMAGTIEHRVDAAWSAVTYDAATATREVVASGGLQANGAATTSREAARAAAGGGQFNGAAAVSASVAGAERVVLAAGGAQLAGAASLARAAGRTGAGGMGIAGAAALVRERAVTASGGAAVSGTAAPVRHAALVSVGGQELGGTAPTETMTGVSIVASGGLGIQGAAGLLRTRAAFGAGGLRSAGAASAARAGARLPAGGYDVGGSAPMSTGDPPFVPGDKAPARRRVGRVGRR